MATQSSVGSGLGRLFNALSDGDAIRANAYNAQTRQNLQDALLKGTVGNQQAQEAAYANMPSDLEQMGIPAGQGAAYTDVTRATGSKVNQLGQLFNIMQNQAYIKGGQDAMMKGDPLGMNFGLRAGDRQPLDMTKIEGNTAVNPNVMPDQQTLATTPYGNADLAQKAYQAAQKLNRTVGKVIPLSSTSAKVFQLAPDGNNPFAQGIDTGRLAHFQEWAQDKGLHDLNAALPKFLQQEEQVRQNLTAVLQQARQAIQAGAPAHKVRSRLEHLGVKDSDLAKAGL